ncbi:MAG: hypothetical protein Q8K99_12935 [Actinomycetota bacterium]|nr:hypothetical protein [Actinomycetota bacterium]
MGIIVYLTLQLVFANQALSVMGSADRQSCFVNQATVERAAMLWSADNDSVLPPDVRIILGDYLLELPSCPSEGTYTWSRDSGDYRCSIHGSHRNSR